MAKKGVKGQGMPLNVIVIAIVLLFVLVIILAIFKFNVGKFSKDVQSCAARAGRCVPADSQGSCPSREIKLEGVQCSGADICCLRVLEE